MYWYNPKTRSTESRPAPETEAEAMDLLAGDTSSEALWSDYDGLRRKGMDIEQALILTGHQFRLRHLERQSPN
jgi:hypothetical protein